MCLGFLAACTSYAVVARWALLGDASQVPALAFVPLAVCAKSSKLYNPLVGVPAPQAQLLQVLCKDRVLLQALHTLLGCGCRGAALRPLPSPGPSGRPGTRRSCSFALERFRSSPRRCPPPRVPGSSAQRCALAMLAAAAAGQPGLRSTVQVMVLLTRTQSGLGTASVAGEAQPCPALSYQSTGAQTQTQHSLSPGPSESHMFHT